MTETKQTLIGLVGCASQKLPRPARHLYVSQLFRKGSACAEATCDRWYASSPVTGDWAAIVKNQLGQELAASLVNRL
jgi:hypothetical protein